MDNAKIRAITIPEIQGCSHQSPYNGKTVKDVVGIVTAKADNGFYMQSEVADDKDCTSEGIFIFTDEFPDVLPGDKVSVTGKVKEFLPGKVEDRNLTITEIVEPAIRRISSGNALPPANEIGCVDRPLPDRIIDNDRLSSFDFEEDGIDYYESLESMLVTITNGIVVGPRNTFNEVVIIPAEYRDINNFSIAGALLASELDANPERLILKLNPENKQRVNIGARLMSDVIGVMDYSYGNYKIRVFGKVSFSASNPKYPEKDSPEGTFRLATYNVKNLSFRDTEAKFRQIASDIINELNGPDVVILHEVMDDSGIEDDGTVTANRTVNRLVDKIGQLGGPEYDFLWVDPVNNSDGGVPGGNIRSVMLFSSDSGIRLAGDVLNYGTRSNPITIGTSEWPFNATRKPLLALFEKESYQFLVVAVHLTSHGLDSPLFGSAQPIERLEEDKRIAQAEYLEGILTSFHQNHPETLIILAGDLNDYPWSKTLEVLTNHTLHDAGVTIDVSERFSYILDGNAFQLDHILVSDPEVIRRYTIAHINTIYDHELQVSDHDPVIIDLLLDFGDRPAQ